jgi:multiple sugar transport system substrate-binding protein
MHTYVIWKFAKNKEAAQKFLIDLEVKYIGAFENSRFYNFPSFPRSVTNIVRRLERDPIAAPKGKYQVLAEISEKYTKNVGYPGFSNAAMDEVFNKFLIPQMFAQAAQGKMSAADAVRAADREVKAIFDKWRRAKKV